MKIQKLISILSLGSIGPLGFRGLQTVRARYNDRSPPILRRVST